MPVMAVILMLITPRAKGDSLSRVDRLGAKGLHWRSGGTPATLDQ